MAGFMTSMTDPSMVGKPNLAQGQWNPSQPPNFVQNAQGQWVPNTTGQMPGYSITQGPDGVTRYSPQPVIPQQSPPMAIAKDMGAQGGTGQWNGAPAPPTPYGQLVAQNMLGRRSEAPPPRPYTPPAAPAQPTASTQMTPPPQQSRGGLGGGQQQALGGNISRPQAPMPMGQNQSPTPGAVQVGGGPAMTGGLPRAPQGGNAARTPRPGSLQEFGGYSQTATGPGGAQMGTGPAMMGGPRQTQPLGGGRQPQGGIGTSIQPQGVYSPQFGQQAGNMAAAQAVPSIPNLRRQANLQGFSSASPAVQQGMGAMAGQQLAGAAMNPAAMGQQMGFANANNMLAGQVARDQEGQGWGQIGLAGLAGQLRNQNALQGGLLGFAGQAYGGF